MTYAMPETQTTLTYDCPRCGAALSFNSDSQKWDCAFCGGSFTAEEMEEILRQQQAAQVDDPLEQCEGAGEDHAKEVTVYTCPSCGAQILTDQNTTATFCVFCHNPAVIAGRLEGAFRPAYVLPFVLKKEHALQALEKLCKKKPLLPRDFTSTHHIEKLSGLYAPFWLFDCQVDASLSARAERITSWSDSSYRYTKTDVYQIERAGEISFGHLPADGSKGLDDSMMQALEPFNFGQIKPFSMAYLSGYLAERYDESARDLAARVHQRIESTSRMLLRDTVAGYTNVSPGSCSVSVRSERADYAMLPVWILNTKYKGETYHLAMNGQTGKMVGRLPMSKGRLAAWFGGVSGVLFAVSMLIGGLIK